MTDRSASDSTAAGSSTDGARSADRDGDIDTVLVVFTDLQGRLDRQAGDRPLLPRPRRVGDGAIEACVYLLAVDVDMTPLPGFDFANWETGYGDFRCVPDPSTLRIVPWLEKTALVLCDLFDEDERRAGRGVAPPDPAPPGRAGRRARLHGDVRRRSSSSSCSASPTRRRRRSGFQDLDAALRLHRGLPHPPDDPRRVPHPPDPQRHGRRGRPGRVLEGRGRARASTRSTCATPTR